jgi:Replication factor-A C terminal domain.
MCEQLSLGDFSGNQWATCFQEAAETLLGMSAQEVGDLFHDDKQFQEVFNKAAFKTCILRLRAKMENYNVSKDGSCFAYILRQWIHNLIPDSVTLHLAMCGKSCVF